MTERQITHSHPTPRTDADEELMGGLWWVLADLARDLERELAEANAAFSNSRIPGNWKLVPLMPTQEMLDCIEHPMCTQCYDEMLAAAPEAPK
jgi:hypothetical protein